MQEHVEMQGHSPVADAQRRSVNADSFRRLTALLKKNQAPLPTVPDLMPAAPAPVAVAVEPVLVPVGPPPPVEIVPPEPEPATEEPPPIEAAPEPEILVEAQSVEIEIAPEPTLEVVPEPIVEPVAVPAVELKPEPELQPKKRASILRRKQADAFSMVLSEEPAKPQATVAPVVQTPQQEAEAAELAQSLLDMMASSAGGGQPQERALAADTLLRMLPKIPVRTKINLSERLCMMETPPPFLVAKLIGDTEISVAGPLLEECMHIADADLLNVIAEGHPDKRRMIARRRRISRAVTDALARTEDDSVLLTLARNQGAEVTQEGFESMADAAHDFQDLLAPLCTRQDLPVHFAFELFWLAPAQLRRYLLHRFLTDSETLTKILKITMDGEEQNQEMPADTETIKAAITSALNEVDGDAKQFFTTAAKLDAATVERILADKQGEPLMALLKVVGLPRSQLQDILGTFTQGAQPLIDPTRDLEEVQAVFDQLSFNKARILLTYWDWATRRSGPYAGLN